MNQYLKIKLEQQYYKIINNKPMLNVRGFCRRRYALPSQSTLQSSAPKRMTKTWHDNHSDIPTASV